MYIFKKVSTSWAGVIEAAMLLRAARPPRITHTVSIALCVVDDRHRAPCPTQLTTPSHTRDGLIVPKMDGGQRPASHGPLTNVAHVPCRYGHSISQVQHPTPWLDAANRIVPQPTRQHPDSTGGTTRSSSTPGETHHRCRGSSKGKRTRTIRGQQLKNHGRLLEAATCVN